MAPKQTNSVPCLELYKSVHHSDWLYDEERMTQIHGSINGVRDYFSEQGALAECFIMRPAETKTTTITERVKQCCDGWTGNRCDIKDESNVGWCFSEKTCSTNSLLNKNQPMILLENCCGKSNFFKIFNSTHQSNQCQPCFEDKNTEKEIVTVKSKKMINLEKLRGQLNRAGIYIPKHDLHTKSKKQTPCLIWSRKIFTFDRRSFSISNAKCWYNIATNRVYSEELRWAISIRYKQNRLNLRVQVNDNALLLYSFEEWYYNGNKISTDKHTSTELTIEKISQGSLLITSNVASFNVKFRENTVFLLLSNAMTNQVSGLCGNFNYDPTDDFNNLSFYDFMNMYRV